MVPFAQDTPKGCAHLVLHRSRELVVEEVKKGNHVMRELVTAQAQPRFYQPPSPRPYRNQFSLAVNFPQQQALEIFTWPT